MKTRWFSLLLIGMFTISLGVDSAYGQRGGRGGGNRGGGGGGGQGQSHGQQMNRGPSQHNQGGGQANHQHNGNQGGQQGQHDRQGPSNFNRGPQFNNNAGQNQNRSRSRDSQPSNRDRGPTTNQGNQNTLDRVVPNLGNNQQQRNNQRPESVDRQQRGFRGDNNSPRPDQRRPDMNRPDDRQRDNRDRDNDRTRDNNNRDRDRDFNRDPNRDRDFNRDRNNFQQGRGDFHRSFYRGHWNDPFGPRGVNAQANAFAGPRNAYGLGLGGYSRFGMGGGYGLGGGFGGGGQSTVGNLLQVGAALAGYGGGYGGGLGYGGYGNYGGYGGYGLLGGYPLGWGLGGGGLGSLAYMSGYLPYSNPYYLSNMGGYNYAMPIRTVLASNSNPSSSQLFDTAMAQFRSGDYNAALTSIDGAIEQNPSDPLLHEFRGLTLFALGNYPSAAGTIHPLLAVGPGWNWDTMSRFYGDPNAYQTQLRALESAVKGKPDDAAQRFLLAYHYMILDSKDAAAKQLAEVERLNPQDRVAADLLKMNQVSTVATSETPPTQQQPAAAPASVDPAALVGTWHAQRDDGSKFDLQLAQDKTFTWTVNQNGQEQKLTGTFDVQKDLLALESPEAGGMVAQVSPDGNDRFAFKLLGAGESDPGLSFRR